MVNSVTVPFGSDPVVDIIMAVYYDDLFIIHNFVRRDFIKDVFYLFILTVFTKTVAGERVLHSLFRDFLLITTAFLVTALIRAFVLIIVMITVTEADAVQINRYSGVTNFTGFTYVADNVSATENLQPDIF